LIFLPVVLLLTFCGGQKQPAPAAVTPEKVTQTKDSVPVVRESQSGVKEEAKLKLPKLWDFFATWCPPCKQQAPIIEELTVEYKGKIEIVSIDTDKNPELAKKFQIQAIPTLIFLDPEGRELSRRVGFFPKDSIVARFKAHKFIE
jgi:thioredoxin